MSTGLDVFDATLQKTNLIMKEIEDELSWSDRREQAYKALRSVLHALRDRLPIHDAVNFSAQLPLLLKGVFFEGWKSESVPIKMNKQEFVNRISQETMLDIEGGTERIIYVVMNKILDRIDPEESVKILSTLPPEITELFC